MRISDSLTQMMHTFTTLTAGIAILVGLYLLVPKQYAVARQTAPPALVEPVGYDFDADGVRDFIVSYPMSYTSRLQRAHIRVYSGATRSLLHIIRAGDWDDFFGFSVSSAGDTNGDGHDDIVVGAPNAMRMGVQGGAVYVFSGLDGSLLLELDGHWAPDKPRYRHFGRTVAGIGDIDGDGLSDFAVAANVHTDIKVWRGVVDLYSGGTGILIGTLEAENLYTGFGDSIGGLGDINGDGTHDIAISSPWDTNADGSRGRVYLFLGGDDPQQAPYDRFDTDADIVIENNGIDTNYFGELLYRGQDLNADGTFELVIASPSHDAATGEPVSLYQSISTSTLLVLNQLAANPKKLKADTDNDGDVDENDLALALSSFGEEADILSPVTSDIDGDGDVDHEDSIALLFDFGAVHPAKQLADPKSSAGFVYYSGGVDQDNLGAKSRMQPVVLIDEGELPPAAKPEAADHDIPLGMGGLAWLAFAQCADGTRHYFTPSGIGASGPRDFPCSPLDPIEINPDGIGGGPPGGGGTGPRPIDPDEPLTVSIASAGASAQYCESDQDTDYCFNNVLLGGYTPPTCDHTITYSGWGEVANSQSLVNGGMIPAGPGAPVRLLAGTTSTIRAVPHSCSPEPVILACDIMHTQDIGVAAFRCTDASLTEWSRATYHGQPHSSYIASALGVQSGQTQVRGHPVTDQSPVSFTQNIEVKDLRVDVAYPHHPFMSFADMDALGLAPSGPPTPTGPNPHYPPGEDAWYGGGPLGSTDGDGPYYIDKATHYEADRYLSDVNSHEPGSPGSIAMSNKVYIRVLDEDGLLVPGIYVTLALDAMSGHSSAYTDENGLAILEMPRIPVDRLKILAERRLGRALNAHEFASLPSIQHKALVFVGQESNAPPMNENTFEMLVGLTEPTSQVYAATYWREEPASQISIIDNQGSYTGSVTTITMPIINQTHAAIMAFALKGEEESRYNSTSGAWDGGATNLEYPGGLIGSSFVIDGVTYAMTPSRTGLLDIDPMIRFRAAENLRQLLTQFYPNANSAIQYEDLFPAITDEGLWQRHFLESYALENEEYLEEVDGDFWTSLGGALQTAGEIGLGVLPFAADGYVVFKELVIKPVFLGEDPDSFELVLAGIGAAIDFGYLLPGVGTAGAVAGNLIISGMRIVYRSIPTELIEVFVREFGTITEWGEYLFAYMTRVASNGGLSSAANIGQSGVTQMRHFASLAGTYTAQQIATGQAIIVGSASRVFSRNATEGAVLLGKAGRRQVAEELF